MNSTPHWIVQLRAAAYHTRKIETAEVIICVGEFGFVIKGSLKINTYYMQHQRMVSFEEVEVCSVNTLVYAIDEVTSALLRERDEAIRREAA